MADFTSALYLGLSHGSAQLRPWRRLTAGAPAALVPPAGSRSVARHLALLLGTETATLGASTLHLFWDLFGQIRQGPLRILADEHLYPVGRWGIERAAAAGAPASAFSHQDPRSLSRRLKSGRGLPPLVVTDGLCPDCGRVPPLDLYLETVEAWGGWLLVDDSQALGLLGREPGPELPYGRGGGGSPRFLGISSPRLLTLSSLAKGLGAPLAVLAGPAEAVRSFERESETLVYSSPPSVAAIRAAEAALSINREQGDRLRARLAERVRRFRAGLSEIGLAAGGGLSPVQSLALPAGLDPVDLYRRLGASRVRTVLRQGRCRPGPRLTFLFRADHTPEEIDRAVETLARLVRQFRRNRHEQPQFRSFSR
ncbi:MAG TPA: aminotransferase class I/II-fold pyridoxal phosphate-dependent enzyme [Thermoanaerobaculia bacterium]|nr:aminotransferase class I/II-fold pyridoxal phosphate-dependent enzyme [Thermoanaerobaculia bacterium]